MRKTTPLPRAAPFTARIDWAAHRDPIGHRVHLFCALLALFLIPLSSSLATVGSTILIVYAALRSTTLRHTWTGLYRNNCLIVLIALFAWLLITLAWSPDSSHGARLLRGSRYVLLLPALIPLARHTVLLLYAIGAGVFLQVAVMLVQLATSGRGDTLGGLDSHPGNTSLWFTLVLGTCIALPVSCGRSREILMRTAAIVPTIGILLAAARSVFLGSILGMIAVMAHAAFRPQGNQKWVFFSGIALLACLTIIPSITQSSVGSRLKAGLNTLTDDDHESFRIDQTRSIWYRVGLDTWLEYPIAGAGLGSTGESIRANERVQTWIASSKSNTTLLRDDYHSLFVSVAAQGGSIGFILLVAWLALLSKQVLLHDKMASILLLGLTSYLIYSIFNTTLFTGRLVAFATILMTFSSFPLPTQMTVSQVTAPHGKEDDAA